MPKTRAKLSPKQKKFADHYIKTGNGAEAARKAYNVTDPNSSTPAVIATENLRKPNIQEYIKGHAQMAFDIVKELALDSKNDSVRLSASKDILDRAGYKPTDKLEVNQNIIRGFNYVAPVTDAVVDTDDGDNNPINTHTNTQKDATEAINPPFTDTEEE